MFMYEKKLFLNFICYNHCFTNLFSLKVGGYSTTPGQYLYPDNTPVPSAYFRLGKFLDS